MTYSAGSPIKGGWDGVDNDPEITAGKIALRVEAVERLGEPRPIRVMDAYHGHGFLWGEARKALPDWEISLYRTDKDQKKAGTLKVDNVRLLKSLDLSKFDLFDLDAYGWPAAQIKTVARKAPGKMVLSTRNTMGIGQIPKVVLNDLGSFLPPGTPGSLIQNAIADEIWEAWLYQLGYRTSRLLRLDSGDKVKRYELLIP
jgi:hypothetical protein